MAIWRLIPRYHQQHLDGMHAFYLNGMFRALVFSLIGIFTPVFLYKIGMREWNDIRWAITFVFGYYLVTRIIVLLGAIPISRIIERIGFRKSVAVSLVLLVINLFSLIMADDKPIYVLAAAIAGGLNVLFYWIARSSAISQDGRARKVGKQMGMLLTLESVCTLLGPLAAGLMIEKWGFGPVYYVAIILLLLSVFPLWHMPPHVHKNGATLKGFRMWIKDRRFSHIAMGATGRSIDDHAISILWPLSIFVMGINTGVLGGIFSAVAVMSLAVRLLMGGLFDKLHARGDWSDELVYGISAAVSSILWIARLFARSLTGIAVIDIGGGIFGTGYSSLYVNYEQLGGMRMGSIAYWVYTEMVYSIGVIIFMTAVMAAAWFGVWKEVGIIMASFWVLVSIVLARESNLK